MSDIRRLVDGDGTDAELALVRAAMADTPPNGEGRRRTYAALGVGTGLALGSSGLKAAGTIAKGSAWMIAKWVGVGAIVGAVSVGAVRRYGGPFSGRQAAGFPGARESVPTAAVVPISAVDAVQSAKVETVPIDSLVERFQEESWASHSAELAPAATLVPSATPPQWQDGGTTGSEPRAESVALESDRHELAAQIALLDRARSALRHGDWAECIAQVTVYRGRFPTGSLSPEATILHVQALLASGNRGAAATLTRGFAMANPNSPFRKRLLDLFAPGEIDLAGTGQWPVPTKRGVR